MTYIRNPRWEHVWESDGNYNGKYMAIDGTLHDTHDKLLDYERRLKEAQEKAKRGEYDFPLGEI